MKTVAVRVKCQQCGRSTYVETVPDAHEEVTKIELRKKEDKRHAGHDYELEVETPGDRPAGVQSLIY